MPILNLTVNKSVRVCDTAQDRWERRLLTAKYRYKLLDHNYESINSGSEH
jgi:hypothetical protein